MAGHATIADGPAGLSLDRLVATSVTGLASVMSKARKAWQGQSADGGSVYLVVELPRSTLAAEASALLDTVASPKLRASLSRAFVRGEAQAAAILSGPGMLDPATMAERIGVTRQTVHNWAKSGRLLALSSAKRGARYPDWQLDDTGQPLAGLQELARALGGGGWTLYRFLVQAHPQLDGAQGLAALKQNRLEALLRIAEASGDGNFA